MKAWIATAVALVALWYLWEHLQLEVGTNDPNVNRLAGLPKSIAVKDLISPPVSSGLAVQVKFALR